MKKLLITLMLPIAFISCKKTDIVMDRDKPAETLALNKKNNTISHSETTQKEHFILWDSCTNENIIFDGEATYSTKESHDDYGGYSLIYKIHLRATGIGEISKTQYHGGIKFVGSIKINENYKNGTSKEIGKVSYRLKFVSKTGQITVTEQSRYVNVNGEIKVYFDNFDASCQ